MTLFACAGLLTLQTSAIAEGPLILGKHWIIEMTTQVQGRPLRFLFSTGAERTIVRPDVYRQLTGAGVVGESPSVSDREYEIRMAGGSLGKGRILGADLALFKAPVDGFKPFDGILGRDFIAQRTWVFDFESRRYRALPIDTPKPEFRDMLIHRAAFPAAKGYFLPVAELEVAGRVMVDTGATVLAMDARELSMHLEKRYRASPDDRYGRDGFVQGVHGPLFQDRNLIPHHHMFPPLTIGDLKIPFPVVYPFGFNHTPAIGIVGPYVLGTRAIAFFPDGAVGVVPGTDRDARLSRALQRVTGLNLSTRGGKLYVRTEDPEEIDDEYEVVAIRDLPAPRLLSLVAMPDRISFHRLRNFSKGFSEVKVRRDGLTRTLGFWPETRS
jgi:hypothetical protein